MRRTVIGVFKAIQQAEGAIREIESSGYANNQISVIAKNTNEPKFGLNEEYAEEVTGSPTIGTLHDFDGLLVQADKIELPFVGSVAAGGPLAEVLIQGDKPLAVALTYYGISGERGAEIENFVREGYILTIIETNNEKASEVANLLSGYGAHLVEKWSKNIKKPLRPWN